MKDLKEFIKKNKDSYIKELGEYVSVPSVSTLKTHRKDIQKAACWISNRMKKAGLKNVKIIKTAGNPIVYGDYIQKGNKKTLLIYGHYDVQPADPLGEWKSEPFKLTRKGDKLYGRGVGDNKAPHLSHIIGIEYLLKQKKKLPVNIKFLIEGEEEVGSRNIYGALNKNRELFKSDIGLVSDGIMDYDFSVIEYGLRGIFCFEINVKCLNKDVHSGIYGGLVDNPAIVLAQIISKLKDENGNILIPNFYSNVRKVSKEEHNVLKDSDLDTKEVIKNTGAKGFIGGDKFLNIEKVGARPSLDVNGMWSGFTGEGIKTIIPSEATAKVSIRLVPYQITKEVKNLVFTFIKKIAPKTCKLNLRMQECCNPTIFDWKSNDFKIAAESLEKVFGKKTKLMLVGGSVGAVDAFKKILNMDCVLTGFSLPDCNWHSPNENIKIENFFKAVEFTINYIEKLA